MDPMPTHSPRRRPARRHALPGSLVAASVLCAVVSTGYAGCFLPDYAKQSDGATNGTPGATTGDPGSGGAGAAGGSGSTGGSGASGGTGNGGGPSLTCDVPEDPPSGGSCVTLTPPGTGGAGGGGGAGGAGGAAGGSGPAVEILCNPVTNEPCAAGNACDTAFKDGELIAFQCYGGQNTIELCEGCESGPEAREFCAGGLACISKPDAPQGNCARYCCTDADCGQGNECAEVTFAGAPPGLGYCLVK
jgi:hypothetical protein